MYEIHFSRAAERYLKKVKDKGLKMAFHAALDEIADNPCIGELKTGDLIGIYCYDVYYKRTDYEVAYRVYEDEERLIVVILAGTRENFYKELKRYM